jgi:hypothetical protein
VSGVPDAIYDVTADSHGMRVGSIEGGRSMDVIVDLAIAMPSVRHLFSKPRHADPRTYAFNVEGLGYQRTFQSDAPVASSGQWRYRRLNTMFTPTLSL